MPSTVREVSATLVLTTHFLQFCSEALKIRACRSAGSCEYIGSRRSGGAWSMLEMRSAITSQHVSMSSCPVRKVKMSPGGCEMWMLSTCFTAASTKSSAGTLRCIFSTRKVLPGILNIGAPPKKSENLPASSVAEVTMSFRPSRRVSTFLSTPKSTSVLRLRSCASSMMIALYLSRSASLSVSLRSTPSVRYLITVSGPVTSSKRIA
mmetsp:Transcript_12415/g.45919  ORF Transcript_12415/g.45919 Transcript_12415/m.45919 type:complete len:207 (+) Transcript_12415:989-1609(+)